MYNIHSKSEIYFGFSIFELNIRIVHPVRHCLLVDSGLLACGALAGMMGFPGTQYAS